MVIMEQKEMYIKKKFKSFYTEGKKILTNQIYSLFCVTFKVKIILIGMGYSKQVYLDFSNYLIL